jgi:hypothetical protein
LVIVKLDGDLWLAVASQARADKFIDNAANSVLKILPHRLFASLSEHKSNSFGAVNENGAHSARLTAEV